MRIGWAWGIALWWSVPALATSHEVRVPVHDPKLNDSNVVHAVNAAFGDGCHLSAMPDAVVVRVDPAKLPKDCRSIKRSVRRFTAAVAPEAAAAQAKNWGLLLPDRIDPVRPIVVMLHGLDGDRGDCVPLGNHLAAAGYQVAYFGYPGDQPIAESGELFARHMRSLHERFPRARIEIVAHSMGGLVARQYVEGSGYAGGIDHLFLVGTPNAGSSWARFRVLLAVQEEIHEYRTNPDWHASWIITEGLGEAGDDLMPGSTFLKRLNARGRRLDVRYTIIAGNKSGVSRYEANCVQTVDGWIPRRARGWWGFRHLDACLRGKAHRLREETGDSDGPVSLRSASLQGVRDFVVVPADHAGLVFPFDGQPPAALNTILDRLRR